MRNLKKLLAVVVTIAMIATFAIPAFATTTAPAASVADKDVKEAVERLSALGIVNGLPDGKYHEELPLTREDFTKMLVVALNLNNAATAAKGITKFSDVASDRWSSGYVNVGVSKGVIMGYANGKFGPGDQLTEAQAITMLVRALGYKDAWLEGTWPENMVNKADELGILDNAAFSGGVATRGIAAILLNNTLDKELVTQSGFGSDAEWTVDVGSSILKDKLGVDEIKANVTEVPAVDGTLDADQLTLNVDKVNGDDVANYSDDFTVLQENLNLNGLLGLDVTVLADDTDVKLVTVDTDNIVVGTIVGIDGDTLTIKGADGEDADYDFTDMGAGDVYINNDDTNNDETDFAVDQYGTFVLNDDDEITFANIYLFDEQGIVVTEVNTDKEYVKGISGAATDRKVNLNDEDGMKIFKNGAEVALADIAVNDVIYTVNVPFGEDTYTYAFVVTNSVDGELTKAKSGELTIGGTAYTVSDDANAQSDMAFSLNSGDDVSDFTATSDLSDAIGETVTAYLDIKGEVRYLVTDVNATSGTNYGVVTRAPFVSGEDDAVKVYNKDDATVTYRFDGDAAATALSDVVEFKLNKDGLIGDKAGDYVVLSPASELDDVALATNEKEIASFDDKNDTITTDGGAKYFINDDTVLMSYYKADGVTVDPAVVSWADIKGKTPDAALRAVIVADADNNAEFVVFTDNYDMSSDGYSAYVTGDAYEDSDGVKVDVVLADGTAATYEIEGAADAGDVYGIKEGDFIVFETNASGEIADTVVRAVYDDSVKTTLDLAGVAGGDYSIASGNVADYSNGIVKIGATSYRVSADAAVYVLTLDADGVYDKAALGDRSDIEQGKDIRLIINKDGVVEMAVVIAD